MFVAFETMHHISQKRTTRVGELTLKLDMSKAYDRVKWIFLDKIMEKLGFNYRWRDLMMQWISSVTYSICINGKSRGCIVLSRGLHQGDPLSPYLFLICAKGLSALIKKSMQRGFMERVAVCRGGPSISHLFFADDSLIFCKASLEECDTLQHVLKIYEESSGQQLHKAKTSFFSLFFFSIRIQQMILEKR